MVDKVFPHLIYDPSCPMCLRFKQALKRLAVDQNFSISFTPVDDPDLTIKFPFIQQEECEKTLHLIIDDQKILKGGRCYKLFD